MRNIVVFAATIWILGSSAFANECRELCDTDWLKNAPMSDTLLSIESADTGARDLFERTALHAVASVGSPDLIDKLVALGADVNARDFDGFTPLIMAVQGEVPPNVVKLLQFGAEVNARGGYLGYSALHWAVVMDKPAVTSWLINAKADVNVKDNDGATPLYQAASSENIEHFVMLLKAGADINWRSENGKTPLHAAMWRLSDPKIATILVESGVDVNAIGGSFKTTPLNLAAFHGRFDAVALLLKAAADVGIRNDLGQTALHGAARNSKVPEIIDLLVKAGINVNVRDHQGKSPLHNAAESEFPRNVVKLLEYGADIGVRSSNGATSLHWAMRSGSPENTGLLIKAGADINARDLGDRTPLHWAAHSRTPEYIAELLRSGADGSLVDEDGKTAFDYAKDNANLTNTDAYWQLNDARFN